MNPVNTQLFLAIRAAIESSGGVPDDIAWIAEATDVLIAEVQNKGEEIQWHCRWFSIYEQVQNQRSSDAEDWRAVLVTEILFRVRFALSMFEGVSGVSFDLSSFSLDGDLQEFGERFSVFVVEILEERSEIQPWLTDSIQQLADHWFVRSEFMLLPRALAYRILMLGAGGLLERLYIASNQRPVPIEEIAQIHFYGAPATVDDTGNARAIALRLCIGDREPGEALPLFEQNYEWVQSIGDKIRVLPSLRIRFARSWVRFLSFVGTIHYLSAMSGSSRRSVAQWMTKYMRRSITPTAFFAGRSFATFILSFQLRVQKVLHNRLLLGIVSMTLRDGRRVTGDLSVHTDDIQHRRANP